MTLEANALDRVWTTFGLDPKAKTSFTVMLNHEPYHKVNIDYVCLDPEGGLGQILMNYGYLVTPNDKQIRIDYAVMGLVLMRMPANADPVIMINLECYPPDVSLNVETKATWLGTGSWEELSQAANESHWLCQLVRQIASSSDQPFIFVPKASGHS